MEQKKKFTDELEANISLGAAIISFSGIAMVFISSLLKEGVLKEIVAAAIFPLYSISGLACLVAIVSGVIGMKDGQSKKKTGFGIAGGVLSIVLNMLMVFYAASQIASDLHAIVWLHNII
ncbi:hypothetical protein J5500_04965 [Candidatus Saccharibacteria bacterium]|nr:hypothetical protein [Candidatus Saccharibacteria bacterium]